MAERLACALAALLVAGSAAAQDPSPYPLRGSAFDPATGAPLYTELRSLSYANASLSSEFVVYRDAAGKAFAQKRLSFLDNEFAPTAEYSVVATGAQQGARFMGKMMLLFSRASRDGIERKNLIEPTRRLVVDAGLKHYLLANLDRLLAGETLSMRFVSLPGPRAGQVELSQLAAEVEDGQALIRVRAESSALDPPDDSAVFEFEPLGHRLVGYRGLSDIPGDDGKPFPIVMRYASGSRPP